MANHYTIREEWLIAATRRLEDFFTAQGCPLPPLRVTCGFPMGTKKAIGQCWNCAASADGVFELMVSPVLDQPMKVFGVLAHELVHAAVGTECGHKGAFKRTATALGLEGKMTATREGEKFVAMAQPILDDLGPYPHAKLDASLSGRKKQGTRLIKCECATCGYTVRTTAKWLAVGLPICPGNDEDGDHGEMVAQGADESEEGEG